MNCAFSIKLTMNFNHTASTLRAWSTYHSVLCIQNRAVESHRKHCGSFGYMYCLLRLVFHEKTLPHGKQGFGRARHCTAISYSSHDSARVASAMVRMKPSLDMNHSIEEKKLKHVGIPSLVDALVGETGV